jgi:hypothetical protein
METKKFENRLAHEKSPYLLQHKDNPVDWYPWGEEAFEKAKKENKPIFLSVGYSTCQYAIFTISINEIVGVMSWHTNPLKTQALLKL